MKQTLAAQAFKLRVLSPSEVLFDDRAVSVSAKNKVGSFDVLAGHANFFSLITKCELKIDTGVKSQVIPVSQGLIKVSDNTVTVYVNIRNESENSDEKAIA